MIVEGQVTEYEFVRLTRSIFYRRPPIALFHVAVLALGLFWSTRTGLGEARTLIAASPLLVLVGLFYMVSFRTRAQYRKNRTLQSRIRFTLGEDGIDMEAEHGRARIPWSKVSAVQETPRYILIYAEGGQAFVIGRHWFSSPEEADSFADTLRQRRE